MEDTVVFSLHRRTRLAAALGASTLAASLVLTAAPAAQAAEQLPEGFGAWFASENIAGSRVDADGSLCVDVPGGLTNPWDAIVGLNGVAIEEGTTYALTFDARASEPRVVRALIGENGGAYRTAVDESPSLTAAAATLGYTFTPTLSFPAVTTADAPEGQIAFQLGGASEDWTFCLDRVSLTSDAEPEVYVPETGPRVRVNQEGYLPEGPKRATLVTEATDPVAWTLRSGDETVASGTSEPRGVDPTAGLTVHTIDFGSVTEPGVYTLVADGETSYEFTVDPDIYQQLRYDALNYFYLARSGTDIDAAIVGEDYAREAGHVNDPDGTRTDGPNRGDYGVGCQDPVDFLDGWTCDYTLDAQGGWYDAGDHGKYVVNGGIAVNQLLSTYERTLTAPTAVPDALGDDTLDLPETGNDVPDVLDEARWELEWMLRMQVPADQPLAGMVHHKLHDDGWTGLPLLPADDPQERELHRPSTAATLNLAAVAAQGARLWAPYDAEFAEELLAAARTAWAAALETPDLYAPVEDGSDGGGAYDDTNVGDEFYWAAAELFLTTGEQQFEDHVLASEYNTADIWGPSGADWKATAALGRLDLATVQSDIPGREAIRDSVVAGAEKYLAWQSAQPFGTAYPGTAEGLYEWGSNSMVLNNQIVLATAFDLTGDDRYRDAVIESMDYLLGRNAVNHSYVTGYGDVYSQNQHSRWFAHSLNPELPSPPVGSVAGGPNSAIQDPVAQAVFGGECVPQFCYLDDIQSWSTNEITINWNSALSWVASFVADQQAGATEAGRIVRVTAHPADVTAVEGERASFTAAATGDPAATVQWQELVKGDWEDVEGATEETLTVTASLDRDGARFRAVFSNRFGSAATEPAGLTVTAAAPAPTPGPTPDPTPAPTPGGGGGAGGGSGAGTGSGAERPGALGYTGGGIDGWLAWLAGALVLTGAGALTVTAARRRRATD
jgi:endoglucanase